MAWPDMACFVASTVPDRFGVLHEQLPLLPPDGEDGHEPVSSRDGGGEDASSQRRHTYMHGGSQYQSHYHHSCIQLGNRHPTDRHAILCPSVAIMIIILEGKSD